MLDNLRNQASFEDDEFTPEPAEPQPKPKKRSRTIDQMTGMNAKQRFFLAVMLLVVVCLMGFMFLMVMDKIVPPL